MNEFRRRQSLPSAGVDKSLPAYQKANSLKNKTVYYFGTETEDTLRLVFNDLKEHFDPSSLSRKALVAILEDLRESMPPGLQHSPYFLICI